MRFDRPRRDGRVAAIPASSRKKYKMEKGVDDRFVTTENALDSSWASTD